MKSMLVLATAAMLAGCASQGRTMVPDRPAATASASGDYRDVTMDAASFVQRASSSGVYEVMSAQLAMSRSLSDVRDFAKRMIQEHDRANRELASLAAENRIPVQRQMSEQHGSMVDQLAAAGSGAGFDRRYLQQQEAAQDDAIALYSSYAANGGNPELRAFARRMATLVRQHRAALTEFAS